ncbi:MAG: GNAT family N-acetyltransferase [Gammaproteobacteria bacterium]|nr:GNAT family N-acetyltransferase [Gammaproteobacteria bacterium]
MVNTLETQRTILRPVSRENYHFVYKWWHLEFEQMHLWWDERRLLSYEEFAEDFDKRLRYFFFTFFVIFYYHDGEETPVGFTYTSRYSAVDRHLYGTMYLTQEYTGRGLGPEAGIAHVRYLVAMFNIRKIYAEIYAYNESSLKAAERVGFVEEGRLKAHRWFDGRFWDLVIMAFYPDKSFSQHLV